MQIADSDGRRAADAGGAMEIDGVAFGEQPAEGLDGVAELGAQFDLFLDHGSAAENYRGGFVMGFEWRKIEVNGAHVVVGVNIEHGGDAGFAAEALDIFNGAGMRADEEARKDLRVG